MTISSSPEVIQQLRRMTGETDTDSSDYSDEDMDAVILAATGNLRVAAAQIWDEKAAKLASLVDVSESGSSRRMSQAHANALSMAGSYRDGDVAGERATGARNRTIRRP
jgi:hypothetical protein